MKIIVNGQTEEIGAGMTVAALVEARNLPSQGVAIALNLEVVRAEAWPETAVTEGDVLDIVTARQGG